MPFHLKFSRNAVSQQNPTSHRKDENYSLLHSAESSEVDSTDDIQPSRSLRYSTSVSNVITVLLCLACAAVNWYLSIAHPAISSGSSATDLRSVSREQYDNLRRPSPFIGFEAISRTSPPIPRNLTNYPAAIAMVNSSSPNQIFSDDPKRHMTETGLVSPEERLIMFSNTVSTIFQFRAIDYGMERCDFNIRILPTTTATFSRPKEIAVYRLASDRPLDTKKISYSNHPSRFSNIATLSVAPSSKVNWHHEFRCSWDSIVTFEVAYLGQGVEGFEPDEDFTIQWWQNKEDTDPEQAIFLVQRESI